MARIGEDRISKALREIINSGSSTAEEIRVAGAVPDRRQRFRQDRRVKRIIEPMLDPIFHPDSYGYRPGRSAKQAIAVTRKRCWQYDWVVEFDIKAAFDQIDHGLLLKAVRTHIREGWIPFEAAEGATAAATRHAARRGGFADPDESVHALRFRYLDGAYSSTMPVLPLCR